MEEYLEKVAACSRRPFTCKFLRDLAEIMIMEMECPKVDRLAARCKAALICWFCENCPFLPQVPSCAAPAVPIQLSPPSQPVQVPPEATPFWFKLLDSDSENEFSDWLK
jgi:hypothetical protein